MKKTFLPLALIVLATLSNAFITDDNACNVYLPSKQGAQVDIIYYDGNGGVTGHNTQLVTNIASTGGTTTVTVKNTHFDKKNVQTSESSFDAKCANGVFTLSMAVESGTAPVHGMQVTFEGDNFDFPATLTPGQTLNGGTLTIKTSNPNAPSGIGTMTMVETITNRRVVSDTTVTTPAGTFNCVKIAMDESVKSALYTQKAHVVTCFAKNVGRVRSETYNDKGKLQAYSVLNSISGN